MNTQDLINLLKEKEHFEYFDENPRGLLVKEEGFLEFVKEFYNQRDNVNWTYSETEEEHTEEIESYFRNCSEMIILAKEFYKQKYLKQALEVIENERKEILEKIEARCKEYFDKEYWHDYPAEPFNIIEELKQQLNSKEEEE